MTATMWWVCGLSIGGIGLLTLMYKCGGFSELLECIFEIIGAILDGIF